MENFIVSARKYRPQEFDTVVGQSHVTDTLEHAIDESQLAQALLFCGPRGVGKTYKVTQYSDAHHAEVVQLNGHSGIESIDILGYNIRAADGSFVWLDGPLTEAFRKAQHGQVILIIDELLRIKSRELNIFISALTPNSSKQFVLNTSRVIDVVDGVGRCEVLKIPAGNLWVVGTTNVGSDYDTDDIDLALADRFITKDVLMEESVIHNILNTTNTEYGNFEYTTKHQLDDLTKTVSNVEYNTAWANDKLESRVTDIEADLLAKSSQIELLTERACDRETDIQHLEDEIETIKSSLQEMHDRLYDVQNYKPISLKG